MPKRNDDFAENLTLSEFERKLNAVLEENPVLKAEYEKNCREVYDNSRIDDD